MKKHLRKFDSLFLVFLFLNSGCGLFGSGGEGANAGFEADLVPGIDTVAFDVSASTTVYHAVTFSNTTESTLTVTELAFDNNVCNDFSIYNVTDVSTGNILVATGGTPNFQLAATRQANVNVRYSQTAGCLYTGTGYQTTLTVYYTQEGTSSTASVTLEPTGSNGGGTIFACDDIIDFSEEEEYAETGLSGQPADGTYYLRIDGMRGYMYVPASAGLVTGSLAILGTDVNGLDPEDFIKPFVQVDVTGGLPLLHQITDTTDFCLPSPDDNQFFGGAFTLLTTDADYSGTASSSGKIKVSDVGVTISAEHIPNGLSVVVGDSNGSFQLSLVSDLSTGKVPTGVPSTDPIMAGLMAAYGEQDDDGEPLLPIVKNGDTYYLQGTALSDGTLSLVGVGAFISDADFIGSEQAHDFLFNTETPAYIFIQLTTTVMTKIEEGA